MSDSKQPEVAAAKGIYRLPQHLSSSFAKDYLSFTADSGVFPFVFSLKGFPVSLVQFLFFLGFVSKPFLDVDHVDSFPDFYPAA
ncbi:MAG: hypothetical protein L0177_17975 [Chloroflexi bacterium]|nr:hypothetical protein [Chloroflexota bacterium]